MTLAPAGTAGLELVLGHTMARPLSLMLFGATLTGLLLPGSSGECPRGGGTGGQSGNSHKVPGPSPGWHHPLHLGFPAKESGVPGEGQR